MTKPTMRAEDYSHLSQAGRVLVDRFRGRLIERAAATEPISVLEVGCGQGWLSKALLEAMPNATLVGLDIREEAVEFARKLVPGAEFVVGTGEGLPFGDASFDLVVCSEVLEHVDDPTIVLHEIKRVWRGHAVLSVPHEPWFWGANLARAKHLQTFGNCPGHIHHWSKGGFYRLLRPQFDHVEITSSFPWLVANVAQS